MEVQVQPAIDRNKRKAPRSRPITSCVECFRRKQKCNREWPCNHCLNRRVADMCRYATVKSKSTKRQQDEKTDSSSGEIQDVKETKPDINDSHSDADSEDVDWLGLESIGYVASGQSPLERDLQSFGLGMTNRPVQSTMDPRRTRDAVLKMFPKRPVVDFLIQHYVQEINWIYEAMHTPTFLKKYDSWWLQSNYEGEDDIQFGVLILRLCAASLQFLPHPKYPTGAVFNISLEELEKTCHSTACKLDEYQPRPRSLVRIQQLYYHINYLKNASNINECVALLAYTVVEAQQMGLHLRKPDNSQDINEFDMEMRRRIFWNLYIWDRFISLFLGRWLLIPEEHIDIDLAHDSIPFEILRNVFDSNAPTPFMERNFQVKVTKLIDRLRAESLKSPPNELTVIENNRIFQKEIVDHLPPTYRLFDPDLSFDALIPTLPRRREQLHILLYGSIANLHRNACRSPAKGELQQHSQSILMESCISVLSCIQRLHQLMGGGPHRFFMIPMVSLEAACALGMCLMLRKSTGIPEDGLLKSALDLQQRAYVAFCQAMTLLDLISQRSAIAKKGVVILRQLHHKLASVSIWEGQNLRENGCVDSGALQAIDPYIGIESWADDQNSPDWANLIMSTSKEWLFDDYVFQSK